MRLKDDQEIDISQREDKSNNEDQIRPRTGQELENKNKLNNSHP